MILKFYAREDLVVITPGVPPIRGQSANHVGRVYDAKTNSWPATKEPYTIDSSDANAQRLAKIARRDSSLFPADKETAAFCGVPFTEIVYRDGAWVAA